MAALGVLSLAVALGSSAPAGGGPGQAPASSVPEKARPRAREPANLLRNPGFEAGRDGWTHMGTSAWGAFDIVSEPTHSGEAAAHLALRWESGRPGQPVKVYGVVQEPAPEEFPEVLAGWYRVGEWWKEAPETHLYVQVVVIVWDDPATAELVGVPSQGPSPIRNYQLRYYLAGLQEPPFRLRNARLAFVEKGPPRAGEWVRFELPLREDFRRLWGRVPSGYSSLRVLFEARWDGKPAGAGVRADVWYDDLYLGPSSVR
jgi:hypothetical protein